jgi:hypothetical protein
MRVFVFLWKQATCYRRKLKPGISISANSDYPIPRGIQAKVE